jgi:predicted DsbA family dithiol-disulfide isomerase
VLFEAYAAALGLNNATFMACFDAQAPLSDIAADQADAQTYGVGGTPASFIIVPKAKISAAAMQAAVDALNSQYGKGALTLFENSGEYVVLVPGAFPYAAFDGILSKVTY